MLRGTPLAGPAADRAREALDRYNQAIERLKSGDWAGFGTELDAMRGLLERYEPAIGRPLGSTGAIAHVPWQPASFIWGMSVEAACRRRFRLYL